MPTLATKDNFAADREAAEQAIAANLDIPGALPMWCGAARKP